jgi:predicted DNA-binding transcriptional regulator AlpA
MQPSHEDRLGNVREVAEICQCSIATVWRRSADGTLPKPIKISGLTRWILGEVAASIEAAKIQRDAA